MSSKRQITTPDERVQKQRTAKTTLSPQAPTGQLTPGTTLQAGLAHPRQLAAPQVLQLQRSVGNRATSRLLPNKPQPKPKSPAVSTTGSQRIQRFSTKGKSDLDYPGVVGAPQYQVADAEDIILPQGQHTFYASEAQYTETQAQLEARKTGIRLFKKGTVDSGTGGKDPLAALTIKPSEQDQDSPNIGETEAQPGGHFSKHEHTEACFLFPGSCRMTARLFMSGNPMDKSQGVFKQGNELIGTRKHKAEESDKEWAMRLPRDMRAIMMERLIELTEESDKEPALLEMQEKRKNLSTIDREIPEEEGDPTFPTEDDALLGALYRKLSPKNKKIFDQEVGINQYADPEIGWSYATIFDFDLLSAEKQLEIVQSRNKKEKELQEGQTDRPHMTTAHWAMLLMKSGNDRLTAETARGVAYSGLTPDHSWSFEMYGTQSRTFHDKWGGSSGVKTTMVTAGVRGSGPTQGPTPKPEKQKGKPNLANMELINRIKNIMQNWQPKTDWSGSPSIGQLQQVQSQLGLNEQAYIRTPEFYQWAQNNAPLEARRCMD